MEPPNPSAALRLLHPGIFSQQGVNSRPDILVRLDLALTVQPKYSQSSAHNYFPAESQAATQLPRVPCLSTPQSYPVSLLHTVLHMLARDEALGLRRRTLSLAGQRHVVHAPAIWVRTCLGSMVCSINWEFCTRKVCTAAKRLSTANTSRLEPLPDLQAFVLGWNLSL